MPPGAPRPSQLACGCFDGPEHTRYRTALLVRTGHSQSVSHEVSQEGVGPPVSGTPVERLSVRPAHSAVLANPLTVTCPPGVPG
jgi:hypothetical protein